jgi:hypothetical protein
VEIGGGFIRVNVKVATWSERSYLISRSGNGTTENPDRYLVWLSKEGCFVELDGDFLSRVGTRRIPKHIVEGAAQQ